MRPARAILALWLLVTAACASTPLQNTTAKASIDCCLAAGEEPVVFRYLGSGGWLITRGSDAVLTAPFFSNPGLLRVGLGRIQPNEKRVRSQLDKVGSLASVRAVLVGHSHYDHVMDLPVIFRSLPAEARLFSDVTTFHTLAAVEALRGRIIPLLAQAGSDQHAGAWTSIDRIRFMAIRSAHAAHYRGFKLFNGHYARPLQRLPRRASQWKEGEPLAFLIDFLAADGRVDFRVYFDDAAHNSPYGFPDAATLAERGVDVAILTVASFAQVDDYPEEAIARLQPRHVLLGHWEDFFLPPETRERPVRLTNVPEFIRRLEVVLPAGAAWTLPQRHAEIAFVPRTHWPVYNRRRSNDFHASIARCR